MRSLSLQPDMRLIDIYIDTQTPSSYIRTISKRAPVKYHIQRNNLKNAAGIGDDRTQQLEYTRADTNDRKLDRRA